MASVVFTPEPSDTDNMRYSAEFSRAGKGTLKRKHGTAAQMMTIGEVAPRTYPDPKTDTRTPLLPKDGPGIFG
jgi:hypothetical protein